MSINKIEYPPTIMAYLFTIQPKKAGPNNPEFHLDFQQRAAYFLIESVLNSPNDEQIVKLLWKMGLVQDWVSFETIPK